MRVKPRYEDFVLRIGRFPGSEEIWVSVHASPAGRSRPVELRLPWTGDEPLALMRSLESTVWRSGQQRGEASRHVRVRPAEMCSPELDPKAVGRGLFEALFPGEIREKLIHSQGQLNRQEGVGLRIRLLIDSSVTDEVGRWPWELLYQASTRNFFNRDLKTPVVRQLDVDRPPLTREPLTRLRVLAVLSDPRGEERLDVSGERKRLETALGANPGVDLQVLEKPTIERLRIRLRLEPFDVLHFVGHGQLSDSGEGFVILEDEAGGARSLSGSILADTLKITTPVRLVLLNACETASLPRSARGHDPYSGVASALIMAGIPAVVANQFPISDRAALSFSEAFYKYLALGDPLESAVAEGRMAILYDRPEAWEWVTPVLFLGVPDGNLFEIRQDAEADPSVEDE
ncbi:MAG: CHAT domain-containing protein, partial [Acidobacteria bacterium]|nr:CHAT domain-containing protein [Acidobacteriota bacterium]